MAIKQRGLKVKDTSIFCDGMASKRMLYHGELILLTPSYDAVS
jgi:hypothetical protein